MIDFLEATRKRKWKRRRIAHRLMRALDAHWSIDVARTDSMPEGWREAARWVYAPASWRARAAAIQQQQQMGLVA